jgi:basic membrane lipoprotein Med (substrate-binding protein (PBP1-ABC) superfamily)
MLEQMRAAALLAALLCVAAGCGGAPTATTTTRAAPAKPPVQRAGLRIGIVGPLHVDVTGAVSEHGTFADAAGDALVVVSAQTAGVDAVAAAANAHQTSHYALVGASAKAERLPNLVGLVLNDPQAALLGGVVAGLVAGEQGGQDARVAWVGPEERALAGAFARGTHIALPGTVVLRAWARDDPAACKEAALGAIDRGAVAVMAHGGRCAEAAIVGAHQQNRVGLRMSDFEFPDVAAEAVVRDAVSGVYHGREDLVFGATSGAVGVRHLDPRIPSDLALRARAAAQELASGRRPSG